MKTLSIAIGIIQLFVGLGAIPAGLSMLIDTSGKSLGMSVDLLKNSPFRNFFIPALFLLLFNGLLNIISSFFSFSNYKTTGWWGMILGGILCVWTIAQIWFIGFIHFLQPTFLLIGLLEMLLAYFYLKRKRFTHLKVNLK